MKIPYEEGVANPKDQLPRGRLDRQMNSGEKVNGKSLCEATVRNPSIGQASGLVYHNLRSWARS
jgi:hypothetical protein